MARCVRAGAREYLVLPSIKGLRKALDRARIELIRKPFQRDGRWGSAGVFWRQGRRRRHHRRLQSGPLCTGARSQNFVDRSCSPHGRRRAEPRNCRRILYRRCSPRSRPGADGRQLLRSWPGTGREYLCLRLPARFPRLTRPRQPSTNWWQWRGSSSTTSSPM